MSKTIVPGKNHQQARSLSQEKKSKSKTPHQTAEHYKKKIIQLFGQIYQCQFARVIGGLQGQLSKRKSYHYKNSQFIEEVGGESDQQMQEDLFMLSKVEIKKLILNIKQSPQIQGDFHFMLENKGKKYEQLQKQIMSIQKDQKNYKEHQLWMIQNYLEIDESSFLDEKVDYFFQIKRNLFTKDQQIIQKNNKNSELIENIRRMKILENLKQLMKNSLGASMYSKNRAINPMLGSKRFSYYLVVNQDLPADQFKTKFGCFKNYLKMWFNELGGILHIIGLNPKRQKDIKRQQQLLLIQERIKILQLKNEQKEQKIKEFQTKLTQIKKEIQIQKHQRIKNLQRLQRLQKIVQNKYPQTVIKN